MAEKVHVDASSRRGEAGHSSNRAKGAPSSECDKGGVDEWTQPMRHWQHQRNRTKGGPRLQQSPRTRALSEDGGDDAGRKRSATEAGLMRKVRFVDELPPPPPISAFAVLSEGIEEDTLLGDPIRVRVSKTAVPAVGIPTRIWKAEVLANLATGASVTIIGGATYDRIVELMREEGLADLLPEKLIPVDHLRLRTASGERLMPRGMASLPLRLGKSALYHPVLVVDALGL
jgi:hypothetical protein